MNSRAHKLALDCYKEVEAVDRKIESWKTSIFHSLQVSKSTAQSIANYQGKVGELEGCLQKLEDTYLHIKAVKENKDKQWVGNAESLSSVKHRTGDLKKMMKVLNERRHEREEIIAEQLSALAALEEKSRTDLRLRRGQQQAVAWYNRVLGFRVEAGQGIKFIFTNIDLARPDHEFSFTIRHSTQTDRYTLLDSVPYLACSNELLDELNQTNDLFTFVRVMREKFQALSSTGEKMGDKAGNHYVVPDEMSHQSHILVYPELSGR
eukprot:Gb_11408 [translate_table: standard]